MDIRSNPLLRLLALVLPLLALATLWWSVSQRDPALRPADAGAPPAAGVAAAGLSPEERKQLAADGDTARDTVATLISEVKTLKAHVEGLSSDNAQLRQRNADLAALEKSLQARLDVRESQREQRESQLAQEQEAQRVQTGQLLSQFEARLNALAQRGGRPGDATDIPVGLGLRAGEGLASPVRPSLTWIEPLHSAPTGEPAPAPAPGPVKETTPVPAYTISRDATLIGSVAMTALIGRIPASSQVQDPYPFKVLVGADNLAASGLRIPGLASMVMSGTATGDWALSCVRGDITSATLVFQNGTVRSYPEPDRNSRGSGQGRSSRKAFGYLSDKFGIPCITGVRKTNALQYLSTRVGLAAAQAAAEAAAAAETTAMQSPYSGAVTNAVTGDAVRFARNRALAGGVEESANWVRDRQSQSFDAVFVASGTEVAIHIDEEIPIDYEPAGRRLNHHAALQAVGAERRPRPLD